MNEFKHALARSLQPFRDAGCDVSVVVHPRPDGMTLVMVDIDDQRVIHQHIKLTDTNAADTLRGVLWAARGDLVRLMPQATLRTLAQSHPSGHLTVIE